MHVVGCTVHFMTIWLENCAMLRVAPILRYKAPKLAHNIRGGGNDILSIIGPMYLEDTEGL
jgi:hypothetical protein